MKQPEFHSRWYFKTGEAIGQQLLRPVHSFMGLQASAGLLILIVTAIALGWANSRFSNSYEAFWETHLALRIYDRALDRPLHMWINEGLMTVFFFVVGLEIKREILIGELATVRKATLPVCAALGGMLVPAVIYFAISADAPALKGWAIPTATDIAFTIGVLTLLGSRIPRSLKVFVAALAIADDLGAVLVIALFYTSTISLLHLELTGLLLLLLVVMNILGYRRALVYLVLGSLVWLEVYMSGIHSTVAGILVALTIPARARTDTDTFVKRGREILSEFECVGECGYSVYTNADHQEAVRKLETLCHHVEPPLLRIEHTLQPWVMFLIVPLFALANAGVHLSAESITNAASSPVSIGTFLGLFLGKQIGIVSFSWLTARLGFAELPAGASWGQVYGCAVLCGIGFTMSIFIADLAFAGTDLLEPAKIGILAASAVSLLTGLALLYAVSEEQPDLQTS